MQDFRMITVTKTPDHQWVIHNPTHYPLIGQGVQGAVFKISDTRCVKIYAVTEYTEKEYASYQAAGKSPLVPKLYGKGPNYIIMEFLNGRSLDNYLSGMGVIPETATKAILNVLREMKRLRFTCVDSFLKHIFIVKNHRVKMIDLVNSFTTVNSFPSLLFGDLRGLGLLNSFLQQVKEIDPKMYLEWHQSPSFALEVIF